jgi:hypothetical protein
MSREEIEKNLVPWCLGGEKKGMQKNPLLTNHHLPFSPDETISVPTRHL